MNKQITNTNKNLLTEIKDIIEKARSVVNKTVNSGLTLMYWNIGDRINREILKQERAEYGKQIVSSLSKELVVQFGKSFELRNLRRMMQFAEQFNDLKIVSTLSTQLSWSHFVELLPIKEVERRYFYAKKISEGLWSVRHTRKQIEQKVYERTTIANEQLPQVIDEAVNTFKDPYFLDFLGLKDGYLEEDLEQAILKEIELFILELGTGFTFVKRQKRMIISSLTKVF